MATRLDEPLTQKAAHSLVRRLLVLALFLLFSGAVQGQEKLCSLNLSDLALAPEFVGFRLGMTKEQVRARVPQVVFGPTDEFGVSKTTINPDFDPRIDKSTFAGVRSISLDFLDDRLTSLWIGYDSSFKVSSVDPFVKRISQSLHLPEAWKPWRFRGQQMNCANFQLTVTMVADGPSFRILDLAAQEIVTARREAKEEAESTAEQAIAEPEIVGDKRKRIYYATGCQPAKEIAAADRVTFKTTQAAAQAGFKVAKNCQ